MKAHFTSKTERFAKIELKLCVQEKSQLLKAEVEQREEKNKRFSVSSMRNAQP
jgi:hypothetical protein